METNDIEQTTFLQFVNANLCKGSARGNWDPREGQQPFRTNPNGVGDRTTTLRRLLIGEISSFWGTSIAITPSGTQEVLPTPDFRGEEVFDWVISSDLLPLNDPDAPTLLHRSSGSRSSPDISFAPSTLAFSCSWEVLQNLGSDHLPILLSIPLFPVFRPNERPPSINFQKAHWDGFAFYFDSHCPSAEEYSSLSLSSAAALFTCLTLNAAKSSILFGRIKRPPKAWWSAKVEEAVSE